MTDYTEHRSVPPERGSQPGPPTVGDATEPRSGGRYAGPRTIDRDEFLRLWVTGAQVVEVLPREEYEWAHLPGARHLPLKALDRQTVAVLDPGRPVVVYCHDQACDMSPRAAWRLVQLGMTDIADYAAGKMDWLAFDERYEGSAVLVSEAVDRQVPACAADEPLARVQQLLADRMARLCVVLNAHGVVMGTVSSDAGPERHDEPQLPAGDAAVFGVTTVRPSEELVPLVDRMEEARVDTVVVTRPDGRLVGLLDREVAWTHLGGRRREHHEHDSNPR